MNLDLKDSLRMKLAVRKIGLYVTHIAALRLGHSN